MEIAVDPGIPTYSGGLGILAGDTVRSASDLAVPLVAVTLLYRKGFFYQRLGADGVQTEEPVEWVVTDFLREMPPRVEVLLEGRTVSVRAWKYEVKGVRGHVVPVYFLDTDLPENAEADRALTDSLYGGDKRYRFCQEAILGIGGVRMLRAFGHAGIERFHLNEGHASLLALELLAEEARKAGRKEIVRGDVDAVRERCIFTTHTPVPAGHDQFPMDLVQSVLTTHKELADMKDVFCVDVVDRLVEHGRDYFDTQHVVAGQPALNMTYLALNLSGYVNGVAKKHGQVSRLMFADYAIDSITNGVHANTWVSSPFRDLFDRYIPGWCEDNFSLRYAIRIPGDELWAAHLEAKKSLLQYVNRETNAGMDVEHLTIGFARRATAYKRADLLFSEIDTLKRIAEQAGPFQIVYAGKAHPRDGEGKEMIRRIFRAKEALGPSVRVAYAANYDMDLAKMITSGVDVWLNTPEPPNEASGTSGMKAALNGIPSLSILDGWWVEGWIEEKTGWSIGELPRTGEAPDRSRDAKSLYQKLEKLVIPTFYRDRERFLEMMRHSIAMNGSFFNTQRMVLQYVARAYFH
jgi:starch phosphorylase